MSWIQVMILDKVQYTGLIFRIIINRSKRGTARGELLTQEVKFGYRGENFSIQLSIPRQILHPSAEILTQTDEKSVRWTKDHPDCFRTGTVTSHPGIASFSICDQFVSKLNFYQKSLFFFVNFIIQRIISKLKAYSFKIQQDPQQHWEN